MKEIENDSKLFCVVEDDNNKINCKPPTKLKNPKIFKPFEMYIKMYGLPDYHELDPTIFVALTYSFIFGVMFGDVGPVSYTHLDVYKRQYYGKRNALYSGT